MDISEGIKDCEPKFNEYNMINIDAISAITLTKHERGPPFGAYLILLFPLSWSCRVILLQGLQSHDNCYLLSSRFS